MFDWIFSNIPLLIVIIGGLLSFFGKSKEKQDTSTPPVNRVPAEKTREQRSARTEQNKPQNPFEVLQRELEKRLPEEFQPSEGKRVKIEPEKVTAQIEKAERILQESLEQKENQLQMELADLESILQSNEEKLRTIKVPKVTQSNVTKESSGQKF